MSYCGLVTFYTLTHTYTQRDDYYVITGKLNAMLLESGIDFPFIHILLVQ